VAEAKVAGLYPGRYSFLRLPSHIGFLLECSQAQNHASSATAGLYSTGVKAVPLCEPSQSD